MSEWWQNVNVLVTTKHGLKFEGLPILYYFLQFVIKLNLDYFISYYLYHPFLLFVFITGPTPFVEWYHTICGKAAEKMHSNWEKTQKEWNLGKKRKRSGQLYFFHLEYSSTLVIKNLKMSHVTSKKAVTRIGKTIDTFHKFDFRPEFLKTWRIACWTCRCLNW